MAQPQLIVKIFDTNMNWLGLIEEVSSLILRTSFSGIENSELKIKRQVKGVDLIKIGSILVFNNQRDRVCIVEDMQTNLEDEIWTFTLVPLKAMLNYRIIEGSTFTYTNQPQATVMHSQVNRQCILATNVNRRFPNLIQGTQNTFGDLISYTEDYRPLGDKLTEIAMMSDDWLGWNVVFNQPYDKFVFETYLPVDRSNSVVFSEEYGNLKNATYNNSTKDYKNWVYVGDSHTQVGDGTKTGFARREMTLDSSQDDSSPASQTAEGKAELNDRRLRDTFDAEIIDNGLTMSTYRTHWNLGDKVKIQSDVLGVQIVKQVTMIEEIYEGIDYTMNVTFGEGEVTFNNAIKQTIREGNGRKITTISGTVDWSNISNKPSTFPPSAHTHTIADVTSLQSTLDSKAPLSNPLFTTGIRLTDGVTNQDLVKIKTGDATGFMTSFGARGGTVVSAGESGDSILADSGVASTGEHLYLSADSNVRIYSNANVYANRHELILDPAGVLNLDGQSIPKFANATTGAVKIQSGVVTITPVANAVTGKAVTFDTPFTSTPIIIVTPNTGVPQTQVLGFSFSSPTTTGFTANIYRNNTNNTDLHWIAIGI